MNEQNKKQIIIVAVLGVVLAAVLFYQFVLADGGASAPSPSPSGQEDRPAATRRTARDRAAAAPAQVLRDVDIDLKELTQSVEVRPLDYLSVRIARNPMAPLVGDLFSRRAPGEEAPPVPIEQEIDKMASKQVSGIIWDTANPVAIVDDIVVHNGYLFPTGAEVYDIQKNRVLFKVGETIIPVEMKEF